MFDDDHLTCKAHVNFKDTLTECLESANRGKHQDQFDQIKKMDTKLTDRVKLRDNFDI